jgi:hypothetical protein
MTDNTQNAKPCNIPERLLPLGALTAELGMLPVKDGENLAAFVRSVYLLQWAGVLEGSDIAPYDFCTTAAGPYSAHLAKDAAKISSCDPELFAGIPSGCRPEFVQNFKDIVFWTEQDLSEEDKSIRRGIALEILSYVAGELAHGQEPDTVAKKLAGQLQYASWLALHIPMELYAIKEYSEKLKQERPDEEPMEEAERE